jgi:hypothetical protein
MVVNHNAMLARDARDFFDLTLRPLHHRENIPAIQQQKTGKVTELGRGGGEEISSPARNRH